MSFGTGALPYICDWGSRVYGMGLGQLQGSPRPYPADFNFSN